MERWSDISNLVSSFKHAEVLKSPVFKPDITPKRKTVASQIQDSVERLKKLKFSEISSREKESRISSNSNSNAEFEKDTHTDHAYSKQVPYNEDHIYSQHVMPQIPEFPNQAASKVSDILKKKCNNNLKLILNSYQR